MQQNCHHGDKTVTGAESQDGVQGVEQASGDDKSDQSYTDTALDEDQTSAVEHLECH